MSKLLKKEAVVIISRKSQITLFIIFGVVILATMSSVYFLTSLGKEAVVSEEARRFAAEKLSSAAVEQHVSNCVENTFEEALFLIGMQGGFIPNGQEGSIITWDQKTANHTDFNRTFDVVYRILRDRTDILPSYPCKTADNPPGYCRFVNDVLQFPDLLSHDFGVSEQSYLSEGSSYFSVESQIESYVDSKTLDCIDISRFKQYDISLGNVSADVIITDEDVLLDVLLPVTIQVENSVPVIEKVRFNSRQPVRLKKLHEAMNEIIQYDNRYLDFRIREDVLQGRYKGKTLKAKDHKVIVDQVFNLNRFDDLIQISDTTSKLRGKYYTYQFMRQNRFPALDYVKSDPPPREPDFEYVVSIGEKIAIKPVANDPDEDRMIYSYSGWKVDFDDVWEPGRTVPMRVAYSGNVWENSDMWKSAGDCQFRCAEYLVRLQDLGEHNITITVTDGEFTDTQIVRVKVEKDLNALAYSSGIYGDIAPDKASIEDPYRLDASSSTFFSDPNTDYYFVWTDITENRQLYPVGGSRNIDRCIMLPGSNECTDTSAVDITEIRNVFNRLGDHKLSLSITADTPGRPASYDLRNLSVYQCLPHREYDVPAYPYHGVSFDDFDEAADVDMRDFFTNHTCCSDGTDGYTWGNVVQDNRKCYSFDFVSCYPSETWQSEVNKLLGFWPLQDDTGTTPAKLENRGLPQLQVVGGCDENDICKVSVNQECSGYRGNACTGDIEYKVELVKECPDRGSGEDERCWGPVNSRKEFCPFDSSGNLNTISMVDFEYLCYNYTKGHTFERDFLGSGTGACDHTWKCSNPNSETGYGGGGDYICQGLCGNEGGCTATSSSFCRKCDNSYFISQGYNYDPICILPSCDGTCRPNIQIGKECTPFVQLNCDPPTDCVDKKRKRYVPRFVGDCKSNGRCGDAGSYCEEIEEDC